MDNFGECKWTKVEMQQEQIRKMEEEHEHEFNNLSRKQTLDKIHLADKHESEQNDWIKRASHNDFINSVTKVLLEFFKDVKVTLNHVRFDQYKYADAIIIGTTRHGNEDVVLFLEATENMDEFINKACWQLISLKASWDQDPNDLYSTDYDIRSQAKNNLLNNYFCLSAYRENKSLRPIFAFAGNILGENSNTYISCWFDKETDIITVAPGPDGHFSLNYQPGVCL